MQLLRLIYDICFFFFALAYLPFFFIKGKHREDFLSRFGRLPRALENRLRGEKVIWIHGVSVGEVVLAFRIAGALRGRFSQAKFLFTTNTPAGRQAARKLETDGDAVTYSPVDFRGAVSAFLDAVSPRAALILETEIWPNLLFELSRRGIPVYILNGRISDRAFGKYKKVRRFLSPVLNCLSGVGAQDEAMRARFLELGARPEIVRVTGNMKFDWEPRSSGDTALEPIRERLKNRDSFLVVAGSTHEGEETLLFEMTESLRRGIPHLKILIAPRHLDRMESIEKSAAKTGTSVRRVSSLGSAEGAETQNVWILDRIGLLAGLYRFADVVFVGGSLVKAGGHNLVEPAFFERPVLFGPNMDNFKEMAAEFKKAGAAVQVPNAAQLAREIISLAGNPSRRLELGRRAKELLLRHRGATQRNMDQLLCGLDLG